jgi:hypothetical protein
MFQHPSCAAAALWAVLTAGGCSTLTVLLTALLVKQQQ